MSVWDWKIKPVDPVKPKKSKRVDILKTNYFTTYSRAVPSKKDSHDRRA